MGYLPSRALGGEAARRFQRYVRREATPAAAPTPLWWDAPTDHFADPGTAPGTFKQKYYVDEAHYQLGGPVFFVLGGEGTVGGPPGGFIADLASPRQALLVQVEHRFYGDSVPNGSWDSANLRLLTVEQSLADFAGFIDWFSVKRNLTNDTKWFIFGGSYPGALASWFRARYPEKSVGSLSSSGVVNAIFNFATFDTHVARAIGDECAAANRAVTSAFESYILARGDKNVWAKHIFGVREDALDGDFFFMLADSLAMMVQYGAKGTLCKNLTDISMKGADAETIMRNAAALIKWYWGDKFPGSCFYDTACLRDVSQYSAGGGNDRAWHWQVCWELSWLQPAPRHGQSQDGQPLPKSVRSQLVNMSFYVDQCAQIFGGHFNGLPGSIQAATHAVNQRYGGPQPKASKVFYTNFADDPWMEASVVPPRDIDGERPYEAAYCDGCGHCSDLRRPVDGDPAELKAVRARFTKYLDRWLRA